MHKNSAIFKFRSIFLKWTSSPVAIMVLFGFHSIKTGLFLVCRSVIFFPLSYCCFVTLGIVDGSDLAARETIFLFYARCSFTNRLSFFSLHTSCMFLSWSPRLHLCVHLATLIKHLVPLCAIKGAHNASTFWRMCILDRIIPNWNSTLCVAFFNLVMKINLGFGPAGSENACVTCMCKRHIATYL